MQESRRKSLSRYTLFFILIFAGAFLCFFVQGKSFIWEGDGFRQYYPALSYLRQWYRSLAGNILQGDFSIPTIDYTIGQGEDVLTTFANYGLGDPLTLLAAFVPEGESLETLYGALVVFRLYLSGLTFWIYCEGVKLNRRTAVYGALAYVFCGFALWSVKDPFFLNAMLYLPLILLGTEFIISKKTPLLLVFGVFFGLSSGYYFFYMIVFATMGYFIVRSESLYKGKWKIWATKATACFASALGGVMLSGALFFPCLYGFLQSSRTENYVTVSSLLLYSVDYYKNMFLHLMRVSENDDASAVGYVSMAVIVLLAVFVLLMKKDKKWKYWKVSLLIVTLAVASPVAGYWLNGSGYITNRFMFIPAFLLALILVRIWPELFALTKPEKKKLIISAGIYAIACGIFTTKSGIFQTLFMAVMLMGVLVVLCVVRNRKWQEYAIGGLLIINLMGNGALLYASFGAGISELYMDQGTLRETYETEEIDLIQKDSDGQFVRTDVIMDEGANPNQAVAVTNGYYGVSVYYSVINAAYSDYMQAMENAPDLMFTHRVLGNDGRTILENLANVQYVVSADETTVPYGFEPYRLSGVGKNIYKNCNATSIGYTYDSWISENHFDEGSVFERQNTLLEAAVVEEDSDLEKELSTSGMEQKVECEEGGTSLPFEIKDAKHFKWEDGKLKVNKKNGTCAITIERKPGHEYYLRLSGLTLDQSEKNTRWAEVTLGTMKKNFLISDATYDFYFGRQEFLVNLGSVAEETATEETLTFRINGPAVYSLDNIELVEVPLEQVSQRILERNEENLQDVEVSANTLTGRISLSKEKLLCLAVPYRAGYSLWVDGEEVNIGKVNKMYIGGKISEGEHVILLKYETPGFKIGITMTILGVFYVIFLCIFHKKCCAKGTNMI